jgi:hypothetical protein
MALLTAVVRAQEAAGLEPIVDAGFGVGETLVDRWRATSVLTDRPVKAVVEGPYSSAWTADGDGGAIDALHAGLVALLAAGCGYIEIHEPWATRIGADEAERTRFRESHQRLLEGVSGAHLSLAITGGSADAAGIETLLAAPYASLAVDLIAGPDNWRLVAVTPSDRGIVCGALSTEPGSDDRREILLWAAEYAASTRGRGSQRVGLATAASLAKLTWEQAERKLAILGEASRLADLPIDDRRRRLDPRAVDIRSAALGQVMDPDATWRGIRRRARRR